VVKIMVARAAPASTRLRAADIVLAHPAKAIEIEASDQMRCENKIDASATELAVEGSGKVAAG
jgi:hypothetical protein